MAYKRVLVVREHYLPNGDWVSAHPINRTEARRLEKASAEYSVYCTHCLQGWWHPSKVAAEAAMEAHKVSPCQKGSVKGDRVRSSQTGRAALSAVTGSWKKHELDWLAANPEATHEEASAHLGRSAQAIRVKRARLARQP